MENLLPTNFVETSGGITSCSDKLPEYRKLSTGILLNAILFKTKGD